MTYRFGCFLKAPAETADRPKAKYGLYDAGGTSTGGGPPRRGRGAGKSQTCHSEAEVGSLTARGRAKVGIFPWQCHIFI